LARLLIKKNSAWRIRERGLTRETDRGEREAVVNALKVSSHLWEQGPLVPLELQTVNDEPLHGLGRGAVHLAEVRGQVATAHHEDDLRGQG